MNLYKQYDPRWGKKYYRATPAGTSTMSSSGCGPSACANIYQFRDSSVTPWTSAQWMMKNGYATNGNGTIHGGIKHYFLALGLTCNWLTERSGNQYGQVADSYARPFREAIKNGNWGVLLMGKSDWTNAGHYIAVIDHRVYQGIDQFYVIDSGGKQRNGWWPWASFSKCVKHFYTITNPDAGKQSYTGTYPSTFPLRGYYKLGDGYKTNTSAKFKEQIKLIQKFLNWAVSANLTVDGEYGQKTVDAVKKFQRIALPKDTADGLFGKKTLAAAKAYKK